VKQIIVAGMILGGVLMPLPALARAVVETAPSEVPLFDDERVVPWDDMDGDAFAQQTPPPPLTPTTPMPATPPATTQPPTVTQPPVVTQPTLEQVAPEEADPAIPTQEGAVEDDFSIGDIPVVETLELTIDKARKALDAYILVREKYKDAALEDFENLQDFVDQSPVGKAFEADVKAASFADVTEWNTTITTLSFAYDNSVDDQTTEIKQQITELQADTEMAADMRERMITALNAMIPSDNNKKVLEELKADPAYVEKLKLLESEAE
jgi:hypothetical protein